MSAADAELTADNKINPNGEGADAAFTNEYKQGSMSVTKKVAGNLASNTAEFTIHVKFENKVANTAVGTTIKVTDPDGTEREVSVGEIIDIVLTNGATAEFTNLPDGVSYTVYEDEQHLVTDGATEEDIVTSAADKMYTVSYDEGDAAEGEIDAEEETGVVVTNTKETTPDTGIFVDSLPYVVLAAGVAAAAAVMIIRKRREVEG